MKSLFIKTLVFILVALAVLPLVALAQSGAVPELGAGEIVNALSTLVAWGASYLLRRYVFPKLNGLAFLALLTIVVTPVLAFAANWAITQYISPGNSYLMSVVFCLLSVFAQAIKSEWDKWRAGIPEGFVRNAIETAKG